MVPLGDGAERPDLFEWNWKTGRTRRITHGAAIRHADPAPDGRTAAAVRCQGGSCDLVRVDLASGQVTAIALGTPVRAFYRPRWSPDGRTLAASMSEGGQWRLVLVDAATGRVRLAGLVEAASRYDAAWMRDGRLVTVSERGGVANLEIVDPASGATRPLTRVTGGAVAPAPDFATGAVFFLNLHTQGLNLHRIHPDSAARHPTIALNPKLWPVAPVAPAAPAAGFGRQPLPEGSRYGIGPRTLRLLPGGGYTAEGGSGSLTLASTDPVGRLGALVQGAYGAEGTWRGGSLNAVYRGFRPNVGGDLFWTDHHPSAQRGAGFVGTGLDAEYAGAALWTEYTRNFPVWAHQLRAGASLGDLELGELEIGDNDGGQRRLAWGQYRAAARLSGDNNRYLAASLGGNGSVGTTGGADWTRLVASASLGFGQRGSGLQGDVTYGRANQDAPLWEQFAVGGLRPTFFDPAVISQRIPLPALPVGVVSGRELLVTQATLTLGGFSPFFWAASTNGVGGDWYRAIGIDNSLNMESFPLVRLPGIRLTGGVLYPLDEPFRRELRAYFYLGYRP
jgi:hypothetical protein